MLSTELGQQARGASWFPDERLIKKTDFLRYSAQNDFDEHAALLGGIVELTQLGSGAFDGRMLFARLTNIVLNIDYSNQPFEKEFQNDSHGYNFGLILDQPAGMQNYGGYASVPDRMVILPPEGTGLMHSPPGLTLLQFRIKRQAMEERLQDAPELADWFSRLRRRPARVVSPWLMQRLRSDCFTALEAAIACKNEQQRRTIDQLLIANIVNALNMEYLVQGALSTGMSSSKLERFRSARKVIHETLLHAANRLFESLKLNEMPDNFNGEDLVHYALECMIRHIGMRFDRENDAAAMIRD